MIDGRGKHTIGRGVGAAYNAVDVYGGILGGFCFCSDDDDRIMLQNTRKKVNNYASFVGASWDEGDIDSTPYIMCFRDGKRIPNWTLRKCTLIQGRRR